MSHRPQILEERLPSTLNTVDDVTRILSQDAFSDSNITGISRADGTRLASNNPCEDRFNRVQLLPLWNDWKWVVSAVYDGHNGSQTAVLLEQKLFIAVQKSLSEVLPPPSQTGDEIIQDAIKKAFVDLDHSIINTYETCAYYMDMELKEKMKHMQAAKAGSCALLSVYDPGTSNLYIACTGDSRAVLGRQNPDGTWEMIALSRDQKADNQDEITRIKRVHPGESIMEKNHKVLGLAVTRAFGGSQWKLPYSVQLDLGKRFFSSDPKEEKIIPTPPYLIVEPVVKVEKISQPSFLILATNGLWDECENHEAVDVVMRWLEAQVDTARLRKTPETAWWKSQPQETVRHSPGFDFGERWNGVDVRFTVEKTTVEDLDNVAVHLLRNACGGNHRELLEGKLSVHAPFSRAIRDDMTVQVIFFHLPHLSR